MLRVFENDRTFKGCLAFYKLFPTFAQIPQTKMKIGKLPVAPIILIVLSLASFILQRIYPGEYGFDSPFISGAFVGAMLVYLLYYIGIWVNAANNNREEAKNDKIA